MIMDIKIHITRKHEGCAIDIDAVVGTPAELEQVLDVCAPARRKIPGVI